MTRERRQARRERSRLFFATDIHGSERCFRKWLNAAAFYDANILVLGGDITGKALAPITATGDDWRAEFLGEHYEATSEEGLEELRQRIRRRGLYDVVMTEGELADLRGDRHAVAELVRVAMKQSLERWLALAEERLSEREVAAFVMLGNDDPPELEDVLRQGRRLTYVGEQAIEVTGGLELVSCGYSTPTPWQSPREMRDEDLGSLIESLIGRATDMHGTIFNIHCPPRDTQLDQAPVLDDEFRPKASAAGIRMGSVGSASVRKLIEKYQPIVSLHGHVHESPGVEKLGATVCINPGSLYEQGVLRGALVEFDRKQGLRSWQLIEG